MGNGAPSGYEIPAAASGDHGLEGFSVDVDARRVGRVAALNRTPDGLFLVVDTGDAYRAVPTPFIAQIRTEARTIGLTREGDAALATSPEVDPRVTRTDTPRLVRYIPRELDRLMTAGERPSSRHSVLWYVGAALVMAGGVGSMIGPVLTAEGVGGEFRWLWFAIPLAVLVAGASALWTAMSRASPRHLSRREKLADALTFVFAISPRTRRRG